MSVEELAKQLEGKSKEQMIPLLSDYTLGVHREALNAAQKVAEDVLTKLKDDVLSDFREWDACDDFYLKEE